MYTSHPTHNFPTSPSTCPVEPHTQSNTATHPNQMHRQLHSTDTHHHPVVHAHPRSPSTKDQPQPSSKTHSDAQAHTALTHTLSTLRGTPTCSDMSHLNSLTHPVPLSHYSVQPLHCTHTRSPSRSSTGPPLPSTGSHLSQMVCRPQNSWASSPDGRQTPVPGAWTGGHEGQ